MSDEPIVTVLKVPLTAREAAIVDELGGMLRLHADDVLRVALWRLADGCHVQVRVGDFAVPSAPRSTRSAR